MLMSWMSVRTDGSALADAGRRVEVDRTDTADRWRYVCPNGHVDWDRTNNHIWCRGCLRAAEAGEDVDPEHYEIYDKQTDETIPWGRIRLVE